jgi:hypothetical protein
MYFMKLCHVDADEGVLVVHSGEVNSNTMLFFFAGCEKTKCKPLWPRVNMFQ